MKILDRYIGLSVVSSMFIVLFILLALFTFVGFFEEVDNIGQGDYEVEQAILYVMLTVPTIVYQLLPMTALLGCTIGLGLLANNSELVVVRAAGVPIKRIVWAVIKIGIGLIIVGVLVGEWIAPKSERLATNLRSVAMSKQINIGGKQGLWAKDGNNIINARKFLPGDRLGEVYVYQFDGNQQVTSLIKAKSASYRTDRWVLEKVTITDFLDTGVTSSTREKLEWNTAVSPELLNVVTVKPDTLSTWGLFQYIDYLKNNGLNADTYEQAFWSKIAVPIVTAIMVLLSVPFIFGSMRSVSIGHRILVGVLVGVGFHLISQMSNYLGLVFHLNIVLSVFIPIVLAGVVVVLMYRRVH